MSADVRRIAGKRTVALTVTEGQLAHMRSLLFADLTEQTIVLTEQAQHAAQEPPDVSGEDALGTYRQGVRPTVELLDAVGWSTRGDRALLLTLEAERRSSGRATA